MIMRLKIVRLVVMLALVILTAPLAASAQPSTKVPRIGWLSSGSPPSGPTPNDEVFQQGLRDLGYVEGQNLTIEYRYAEGNRERLPDLAVALVRLHVDVIVAEGTTATRAAKQATSTIPIIMAGVGVDPVEAGLVASLARPEGNVTGVAAIGTAGWEKRLELLKEAVPRLARLAVLWNPANAGSSFCVRAVQAVAMAMGVQLHALEVRDANAIEHAFAEIAKETPDALLICADGVTLAHARPIADFAMRSRLALEVPL
jgi:putative ABC transport system substrate-binding protein